MDIKQSKLQTDETIKYQKEWLRDAKQTEYHQHQEQQRQFDLIKSQNCEKLKILIRDYFKINLKNKFSQKLLR